MSEAVRVRRAGKIEWFESPRLARLPRLVHAFGSRRSVRSTPPVPPAQWAQNSKEYGPDPIPQTVNRHAELFSQLGAGRWPAAALRQIHSDSAFEIFRQENGPVRARPATPPSVRPPSPASDGWKPLQPIPEGDVLLTTEPGVLLSVRTADCMPVLIADPDRPAVAAVHSGWRGTRQRIAGKTAVLLAGLTDSEPRRLVAVVGPSIQKCCYQVGEEIYEEFRRELTGSDAFFSPPQGNRKPHLDLPAAARAQLMEAGLLPENIHLSDLCTRCRDDYFFSYRRERKLKGQMLSVIGIHAEEEESET